MSLRQYTICENHTTVHGLLIHTLTCGHKRISARRVFRVQESISTIENMTERASFGRELSLSTETALHQITIRQSGFRPKPKRCYGLNSHCKGRTLNGSDHLNRMALKCERPMLKSNFETVFSVCESVCRRGRPSPAYTHGWPRVGTQVHTTPVIMAGGPGGFERREKKQQMTELRIRNQCMLDSLACQNQSFV